MGHINQHLFSPKALYCIFIMDKISKFKQVERNQYLKNIEVERAAVAIVCNSRIVWFLIFPLSRVKKSNLWIKLHGLLQQEALSRKGLVHLFPPTNQNTLYVNVKNVLNWWQYVNDLSFLNNLCILNTLVVDARMDGI